MSGFIRTFILAMVAAGTCHTAGAQTLKIVKDRGMLMCGVGQGLAGFSQPDGNGNWIGFDVDFCRALAAAIFNDSKRVLYVPYSAGARFPALQSRAIDVLSRNSTWTMSRDTELGLSFPVTTYFDGQGFMVPRSLKTEAALDLGGASVCVQSDTTTNLNLLDFFRANKMKLEALTFGTFEEALRAYTRDAAYASFDDTNRGTIANRMLADFVMLDRDITRIPPAEVRDATVVTTVIGGRIVHSAN